MEKNEKTEELQALFRPVLEQTPEMRFCPEKDPFPADARIKAIRFSGLPCGGCENTVFAYLGFPENACAQTPVPGMVLVHGGGGHAYAEWVRAWVDRGYAAVSFDGFGQIYTGEDGTYEADLDYWKPDPAAHLPNDGFLSVGLPFAAQGITYFIADVILAHNLLRADERVNRAMIGLTGISWGGIAASIAIGFDNRFAFAAPVYGCGFLDITKTPWWAGVRDKDVTSVWDAGFLLDTVKLPVRFFNGDADPFFDANAATASAAAVPNGSLTLLPGFTHGQIEGSSIPELFRFADAQTGRGDGNIRITAVSGTEDSAELRFSLPEDAGAVRACIYYKTEDLIYEEKYLREAWRSIEGTTRNGSALLRIPAEARLFYFCVSGDTDASPAQTLHATTGVYTRKTWEAAEY